MLRILHVREFQPFEDNGISVPIFHFNYLTKLVYGGFLHSFIYRLARFFRGPLIFRTAVGVLLRTAAEGVKTRTLVVFCSFFNKAKLWRSFQGIALL